MKFYVKINPSIGFSRYVILIFRTLTFAEKSNIKSPSKLWHLPQFHNLVAAHLHCRVEHHVQLPRREREVAHIAGRVVRHEIVDERVVFQPAAHFFQPFHLAIGITDIDREQLAGVGGRIANAVAGLVAVGAVHALDAETGFRRVVEAEVVAEFVRHDFEVVNEKFVNHHIVRVGFEDIGEALRAGASKVGAQIFIIVNDIECERVAQIMLLGKSIICSVVVFLQAVDSDRLINRVPAHEAELNPSIHDRAVEDFDAFFDSFPGGEVGPGGIDHQRDAQGEHQIVHLEPFDFLQVPNVGGSAAVLPQDFD